MDTYELTGFERRKRERLADLEKQCRERGSKPIRSLADVHALAVPELFAEEGELEEFLEFTYAERRRNLA